MDIEKYGNWIEAGVWFVAAALVAWKAFSDEPRFRRLFLVLAITIAFFGGSDLVEAQTGAWWRPWWLLLWKGVCVFVMAWCFTRYFKAKRMDARTDKDSLRSIALLFALFGSAFNASAADSFQPKPVPHVQALPLPHHEISFQRDDVELTRYHFDPADKRPFLYPIIGPSGRSLTRMGHPHDPFTHSHHNSLWVSHHDVNGISFWEDRGPAQIHLVRVEEFEDADDHASATVLNSWNVTNKVLLLEHRRMTTQLLDRGEWLLLLDMQFEAQKEPVTLGKTSFGLAAVRMARSIGVHDGAGTIRNSEGGVNEAGVHWKKARWVDYSGAIVSNAVEGITFFDHPSNPNHPSVFHVRDDGWMGAALTFDAARVIEPGKPLKLRYGFYVHSGLQRTTELETRWQKFAGIAPADFTPHKR